jgi:ketosteroid isomerase-like protein
MSGARDREIVSAALAAFNDRDVEAFAALTSDDFEWSPSMGPIEGERFLGREGVRRYFRLLGGAWERFQVVPEDVRDHASGVLVLGRLQARGLGSGAPVDSALGMAFDLRDGAICRIHGHLDRAEALRAVGLAE